MNSELLKGHLDLLLLSVLRDRASHGYAVVEALQARSGGKLTLPEGTVYPALHRLERDGLLKSHWDESGPRRRRVYEISALGVKKLDERRSEWRELVSSVRLVVEGA